MALAERITPAPRARQEVDVVLGDDWVAPDSTVDKDVREERNCRGLFSLKQSALTRKIITFNLIALNILVAGILYLNSSRDSLASQRAASFVGEVELVADVFEAQIEVGEGQTLAEEDESIEATLDALDLRNYVQAYVFGSEGGLVANATGSTANLDAELGATQGRTIIVDALTKLWTLTTSPFTSETQVQIPPLEDQLRDLVTKSAGGETVVGKGLNAEGGAIFIVTTPIMVDGESVGVVALASASGEIDALVRSERERVLQMFLIATLVSIGLSLVLASTISNPLSDLAMAAEVGRSNDSGKVSPARIRIPDLTARPDEIGRLSGALRGMVAALYDRIDSNEQFAADVAHEIKNPLASLRSAVGTMRVAKRDDQREKLFQVIEHDVRRLDRLVSDISNASRLDSELVKEEEERFDLLKMVGNLAEYLGEQAKDNGVEFIADLPAEPIMISGLEGRLAQVFVNLITNATSFCEEGDAIRVWARQRENRVLVVVEDTGPGIPEQALSKVFKRFYSERPEGQFGNNSGLGLAISKQIVEAHGGVIGAENIRPTAADVTSEPLGARFVVGLPL
ncbi:sensor N-terminal transmembrane domain-containing protein [Planktotalea sp.]|uniref:sensor N-terminal transmembrane domain-containing protein n=1 Tax=Planktotalea sp. TaxID=2029877 RepID=UPI0035C7CD4A